MLYVIAHKE